MMNTKDPEVVIENKVARLCKERGWDRQHFVGVCLISRAKIDGRRLTAETAGRVYDGDTAISMQTAALVAAALGVKLEQIFTTGAR